MLSSALIFRNCSGNKLWRKSTTQGFYDLLQLKMRVSKDIAPWGALLIWRCFLPPSWNNKVWMAISFSIPLDLTCLGKNNFVFPMLRWYHDAYFSSWASQNKPLHPFLKTRPIYTGVCLFLLPRYRNWKNNYQLGCSVLCKKKKRNWKHAWPRILILRDIQLAGRTGLKAICPRFSWHLLP